MSDMTSLLTSNVEFTGLLLGVLSLSLGFISLIGLVYIILDEVNKFRIKQKEEQAKIKIGLKR